MDLEEIFLELGNQTRLNILNMIVKKPEKLSSISKDLGLAMPEVHRNITRLTEAGLIQKDADGYYSLTTLGTGAVKQISSFSFITKYQNFFETHSFGYLPDRYIQSVGSLEECEFLDATIVGFDAGVNALAKVIKESERFLYMISPYTTAYFTELIYEHVSSNKIEYKYIVPENAMVAKTDLEIAQKYKLSKLLAEKIVQRRMSKEILISLIITEKEAAVSFPLKKGIASKGQEPDLQRGFFGKNKNFLEWSMDYFEYRWRNAGAFSESKIRRLL